MRFYAVEVVVGGVEGGTYFFDDGLEVLGFFGRGVGFGAEGGEMGEHFMIGEGG